MTLLGLPQGQPLPIHVTKDGAYRSVSVPCTTIVGSYHKRTNVYFVCGAALLMRARRDRSPSQYLDLLNVQHLATWQVQRTIPWQTGLA